MREARAGSVFFWHRLTPCDGRAPSLSLDIDGLGHGLGPDFGVDIPDRERIVEAHVHVEVVRRPVGLAQARFRSRDRHDDECGLHSPRATRFRRNV